MTISAEEKEQIIQARGEKAELFCRDAYDLEPFVPLERIQAAWSVSVNGITLAMLGEKCRKS